MNCASKNTFNSADAVEAGIFARCDEALAYATNASAIEKVARSFTQDSALAVRATQHFKSEEDSSLKAT